MHNVDIRNVSLGQIMYFIRVAETMNISLAAEHFHLTQPVLSKKIASLEEQLDLMLFIRTNRLISLTPAGEYLYHKWKSLVASIEENVQHAHVLQTGRSKSLVIACMDSFKPNAFLLPLIKRFRDEHPDINLRIESDAAHDIRNLLISDEADVIFSIQYDFESRDLEQISFKYLGETTHCACMKNTNPLADRDTLSMDELKFSEFICISPQILPEYVNMLHELCRPYGFVPDITSYVASANSLTLNIKSDKEIFICDKYYDDSNSSDHRLIPIRDTQTHIVMAWRNDNEKSFISDLLTTAEGILSND